MSISSQLVNPARCAVLILSLSTAFTGTAYASGCGDISKSLTTLGDRYYDVDRPDLNARYDKAEQQILLEQSHVFGQLQNVRFKNGKGERTRCFGTDENARTESSTVELSDIIQQDNSHRENSELAIHAFEHDKANRRIRRESIYLTFDENIDALAMSDSNTLTLNTRRRQSTAVGSYLREIATSANTTDSGVDIKQSIYVNGYLAEWFTWSLNTEK